MLKSVFSIKTILFSALLLSVVTAAYFLYYRPFIVEINKDIEEHHKFLRSMSDRSIEKEHKFDENFQLPDEEKLSTTPSVVDANNARLQNGITKIETSGIVDTKIDLPVEKPKPVKMSPHGFGPYPELPDGWPKEVFYEDQSINQELITRVRIKLFNQGTITSGAAMSNNTGLIYPITKDRIYVEWATTYIMDIGEVKYITSLKTHPDIKMQIRENANSRQLSDRRRSPMLADDIPHGVEVLGGNDGIDPYEFLGLQRK